MALSEDLPTALERVRTRAFWAVTLVLVVVCTNLLGIWALLGQLELLADVARGIPVSESRIASNEYWIAVIHRFHVTAYGAAAIVYLMWFHGAYQLLSGVGTQRTRTSATAATWEWAIPIVNFVRPYRSVVEMWQRSAARNSTEADAGMARPTLVGLWWVVLLLVTLGGRFIATFSKTAAGTVEGLRTTTDLWVAFYLIQGVAGILAILVVGRITRFQERFLLPEPTPLSAGVAES